MKEKHAAKLAELKLKVEKHGWTHPIPVNRQLWPAYLRELRLWLGLPSQEFWELFDVPINTGYKYEQLNSEHVRLPKYELMERLAVELGLEFAHEDNPHQITQYLSRVEAAHKDLIAFIIEHRLTLDDLQKFIQIRELLRK